MANLLLIRIPLPLIFFLPHKQYSKFHSRDKSNFREDNSSPRPDVSDGMNKTCVTGPMIFLYLGLWEKGVSSALITPPFRYDNLQTLMKF